LTLRPARCAPADPAGEPGDGPRVPARLTAEAREVVVAVESMTGWRFVAEECARAGARVHLAEPAATRLGQDRKRRAKTDKLDARLLREMLVAERLPESWIPPAHILDLRAKVRLRKTMVDERKEWLRRIHAVLFHHGVPAGAGRLARLDGGSAAAQLAEVDLPAVAQQQIRVALCDHRASQPRGARAGPRAGAVRAPPARLPRADGALRHRAVRVDGDPRGWAPYRRGGEEHANPLGPPGDPHPVDFDAAMRRSIRATAPSSSSRRGRSSPPGSGRHEGSTRWLIPRVVPCLARV
jgi:hypothetical protein